MYILNKELMNINMVIDKYRGKFLSILGDSISTLEGYNPQGFNVFYEGENCLRSGVLGYKKTWWGQVTDYFSGRFLVNNSWSGGRVTMIHERGELLPILPDL